MSAISAVATAASHHKMPPALKIGLAVAGIAVLGIGLAACTQAPEDFTRSLFKSFDRTPGDGGISSSDAVRGGRTISHQTVEIMRAGDRKLVEHQTIEQRYTSSMERAYTAARGSDAIASWQELSNLANTYDRDGKPGLSLREQNSFQSLYGPERFNERAVITDRWQEWIDVADSYPNPHTGGNPIPGPGDDYPAPGGNHGPGDDYPAPGNDYPAPGNDYPSPGNDYPAPGNGSGSGSGNEYPMPGDDYLKAR